MVKEEKEGLEKKKEAKGGIGENIGKWIVLLVLVPRNFGVANAASEDIQNREEHIDLFLETEQENEERFQEQMRTKDKSEMRKPANM